MTHFTTAIDLASFPRPPAWTRAALCAQVDPELFFPEKGASTSDARRVCLACPVSVPCLEYALEHGDQFGVYGGLTAVERRALKRCRRCPRPAAFRSTFCGDECRAESRAETKARFERKRAIA